MEAKLAQYRAEKAKHYKQNRGSFLQSFQGFGLFRRNTTSTGRQSESESRDNVDGQPDSKDTDLKKRSEPLLHDEVIASQPLQTQAYAPEKSRQTLLLERGLKILLWLVLWGLFIELQFGAVFFIISMLVFVYFNTRTGPKEKDKLSAYSVFNPNFEQLDGQFTSEQFEKELRYGAGSVH